MLVFTIEPLIGIRNSVRFGMTRGDVHALLAPAKPDSFTRGSTEVDGFHGVSLQVSYDTQARVQFIEFARSGNSVLLDGIDVLQIPAAEVIARLGAKYELDPDESEPGYCFTYLAIELGFWRPVMPESDSDDEGRYFESVGFGRRGYYSYKNG